MLDQALGLFNDHLGDLHVARGGLIESTRYDLTLDRALHLGHLFRALVDEQHDQVYFRMVGRDRRGDILQQHGLASLRRRDDQTTLTLADRRDQIDRACGQILGTAIAALQLEPLGRVKRREVLEQHFIARAVRRIEVDLADLQQRKVALAVLRWPNQARDRVASAQIEAADLTRAGQIRAIGRTQEAKAVLQDLQYAVTVGILAVARVRLEDREDDVLFTRACEVLQTHRLRHLDQLVNRLGLQLGQIHRTARERQFGRTDDLGVILADRLELHHVIGTPLLLLGRLRP